MEVKIPHATVCNFNYTNLICFSSGFDIHEAKDLKSLPTMLRSHTAQLIGYVRKARVKHQVSLNTWVKENREEEQMFSP